MASATICRVDAGLLVQPTASGDIMVNDEIYRYLSSATLVFADGIWTRNDAFTLEKQTGQPTCNGL